MNRIPFKFFTIIGSVIIAGALAGCGTSTSSPSDGTASAVATAITGGSVSSGENSNVAALDLLRHEKESFIESILMPSAFAETYSCSGNGFGPSTNYTGPGNYAYTPRSCSITYRNGTTASDSWSGTFTYNFGTSCTATGTHADFKAASQPSGCAITRNSASGGTTRTLTGPDGNAYSVKHDTTGTNTGYNSTNYPTTSSGVIRNCTAANCGTSTLVVSGSHLTGTKTPAGGSAQTYWDHTISTSSSGLTITGTGTSTTITAGLLVIQHNLAKYTTTTTFSNALFGDANCCFPTSGSITSTFSGGPYDGKTETLTYSSVCGEATLTASDGTQSAVTLIHCL